MGGGFSASCLISRFIAEEYSEDMKGARLTMSALEHCILVDNVQLLGVAIQQLFRKHLISNQ